MDSFIKKNPTVNREDTCYSCLALNQEEGMVFPNKGLVRSEIVSHGKRLAFKMGQIVTDSLLINVCLTLAMLISPDNSVLINVEGSLSVENKCLYNFTKLIFPGPLGL